ncbi:MAG: hypothetical protein QN168_08980 [Armatimonadota bacterium]|nr:hypothetical protein [Armatimonadota bacterium]
MGAHLLWHLPGFLRSPLAADEARQLLRRRFEQREADFLALMRRAVYAPPDSPYRRLLSLAGCEYPDLHTLVGREGIEQALWTLYRAGVFLTADEFKGRRPVVRGSTTFVVRPEQVRNPGSSVHFTAQTSGSRGARTAVGIDLGGLRDEAVDLSVALDAWGGRGWVHALWGVPGGSAVKTLLRLSFCGARPARWFSQVDPASPELHARYRLSGHLIRWSSLLAGAPLPRPQYVSLEDPLPVARWMAEVLQSGRTPHLTTFSSAAVRLAQAAAAAAIDLRGARFTLGGEPTTSVRLSVIRRIGAEAMPRYATVESGHIGYGCLAPETPDDLHLLHDLHAVVPLEAGGHDGSLPAGAFLVTSLRPTASLVLLNVSLGDQAVVAPRACGCPLEAVGWTTHIHSIHSHEKLTAGGMTFQDADVVRVLEELLPARFGGGPADYQLVEEESDDGRPLLRLLVHPSVGPLDPDDVARTFLAAIGAGQGPERLMGLLWRDARLLRVERQAPQATASGKILHLHQQRRG